MKTEAPNTETHMKGESSSLLSIDYRWLATSGKMPPGSSHPLKWCHRPCIVFCNYCPFTVSPLYFVANKELLKKQALLSTIWKSLSVEIPWKMEGTRLWAVLNQGLFWSNMLLVETSMDITLNLHRLWLTNTLCNYQKMTEYRRGLTADKSLCLYQTCWWQRELQSPHETEKRRAPSVGEAIRTKLLIPSIAILTSQQRWEVIVLFNRKSS